MKQPSMLNLKTIRDRLHQAPFTRFQIQLTTGGEFW